MQRAQLTVVGLGLGGAEHLTIEARQVLRTASEVWVPHSKATSVQSLPSKSRVSGFDDVYARESRLEDAEAAVSKRLIEMAGRPSGVVFAVPGHPLIGDRLVQRVLGAATQASLTTRVVAGLSFLEPVCAVVKVDPMRDGLHLVNAVSLMALAGDGSGKDDAWQRMLAVPPIRRTMPVLISEVSIPNLGGVVSALSKWYPDQHGVQLVTIASSGELHHLRSTMGELSLLAGLDGHHFLYIPPIRPLDDLTAFSTLHHIIARLRAPGGCPWDREQTHQSLKPYLIEECYEVLEALDEGDVPHLEEELGDLLLQIVLHAQLAAEATQFDMSSVLARISNKLIRRHPHVFGSRVVSDASEVVRNWEQIKRAERGGDEATKTSLLGGVPNQMPALGHASSLQRRAASVGFAWSNTAAALAKVAEEAGELQRARDDEERLVELGDVLFALVSAGREMGIDAEEALRLANRRFITRFTRMEQIAQERGIALKGLSANRLEQLWREAKAT